MGARTNAFSVSLDIRTGNPVLHTRPKASSRRQCFEKSCRIQVTILSYLRSTVLDTAGESAVCGHEALEHRRDKALDG